MSGRGTGVFSRIFLKFSARQSFDAVAAVAFIALALPQSASAVVLDQGPDRTSPVWVKDNASCLDGTECAANSSFLSNTGNIYPDSNIFRDMISQKRATEMKQDYVLQNKDYDQRRDAGISGTFDSELNHVNDMKGFSQNVMNEVQSHQGEKATKAVEDASTQNPDLQKAQKPVEVAGVIYGLYSDKIFAWKLEPDMTLLGHMSLRNQTGTLSLNSPLVTSAIDVNNQASDPWSPTPVVPDPTVGAERYRFSVSKPLALSVTSSLAYGSTSNAAIASLSRPIIVQNLTCVVDSVYPMDDMGGSRPAEQRLKFFYHLDF
jgi:hypothetical protein